MNTEPANKCGLKREDFQTTVNGKKTDLFVLRNKQGNEVAVTNYGGAVVAIMMPDKDGNYGQPHPRLTTTYRTSSTRQSHS